jgi:hypothetical protein
MAVGFREVETLAAEKRIEEERRTRLPLSLTCASGHDGRDEPERRPWFGTL